MDDQIAEDEVGRTYTWDNYLIHTKVWRVKKKASGPCKTLLWTGE